MDAVDDVGEADADDGAEEEESVLYVEELKAGLVGEGRRQDAWAGAGFNMSGINPTIVAVVGCVCRRSESWEPSVQTLRRKRNARSFGLTGPDRGTGRWGWVCEWVCGWVCGLVDGWMGCQGGVSKEWVGRVRVAAAAGAEAVLFRYCCRRRRRRRAATNQGRGE
jgi:hypothetical protein